MTFTTPQALVLLLGFPIVIYLGWPRTRFRRGRDIVSLFLRLQIMLLLVLAVSGTQVVRTANRLAIVFLVDRSDSITQEQRDAQTLYLQNAISDMGADDEFGIVVFGANAIPERSLSSVRELATLQSEVNSNNTNIAGAIRLGIAMLPDDAAQRIVILSDGRPTMGDAEAAAQLASATGVEISYVPFGREPLPEVQVTNVRAPSAVNADQEFDLSMTIDAEQATPATITVFASGEIIHRQEVVLREGANSYTLPLQGGGSGFKDFRVQVDPVGADGFYQNNQLSTFTEVIGPPRVLLVSLNDDESRYLQLALEESRLTVDVARPSQLPIGLAPLAQYNSVILANIPATQLSPRRMETLNRFVNDLGGGLVVVGGPDSYGAGGYFQTPLEDALPVEMRLRDQQRLPQLTIAYVIDRSGSMSLTSPSGIPHIELAKEAMIRSIDFLQPTDRAGVVSFDSQGYWIADIQPVQDRLGLQLLIASLRAGGGTDILAGMNLVSSVIRNDESQRKHIILLTDGGANPNGLVELTEDLYQNADVTTSVIAIGAGATSFLDDMATAGGGNYHVVEDVDSIPAIFAMETVLATRSYITEEQFVPTVTATSEIMNGITSAPSLLGYVSTTPKVTAQVILRGPEPFSDPILAAWQYGLGRSVAFTSDATARWGANWVTWGQFSRFWDQVVRWTITESSNNLETHIVLEGEQARLIVDARDGDGNFLNGLNLQSSLVDPDNQSSPLMLRQVAPGHYEGVFTPGDEGAYFLRVTGTGLIDGETRDVNQTMGWVLSYSPEYNLDPGADVSLLDGLASITGGRSLADNPAQVFAHNLEARNAVTPIWPWLLIAAVLLLPLDIAVRRLVVTRRDLQRARAAIFGRSQAIVEEQSERISALMEAKQRARETTDQPSQLSPSSTVGALRQRQRESRSEGDGQSVTKPAPTQSGPRYGKEREWQKSKKDKPAGNVAGELLKRRKERDKED